MRLATPKSFLRARHPPGAVLLHLQKANGLGVPVGFTPYGVKRTYAVSGPPVKEFRINFLTPMTPEAESCPVREWLRRCELHGGSFIDRCGLGTLMPEEEPESPEEVRSQCRRSLPNADE